MGEVAAVVLEGSVMTVSKIQHCRTCPTRISINHQREGEPPSDYCVLCCPENRWGVVDDPFEERLISWASVRRDKVERVRPQFGSARGMIEMSDDFNAPMEELKEYL
jgi:hypothetical protein